MPVEARGKPFDQRPRAPAEVPVLMAGPVVRRSEAAGWGAPATPSPDRDTGSPGGRREPRTPALCSADGDAIRALFDRMLERLPLLCTLRATARLRTELILTS
ncbi:MAG: hypothetical protein ABIS06_17435 [Vicinamibacterales bacterium]